MKIIKIITWLSDLVSKKRKYDFEIKLSGRVNFIENPQDFFDKFNTIFLNDQATKRIKIDITDAAFIYPKVLFFIISLKETLKKRGDSLDIVFREGSEVHEYIDYAGFCKEFDIPVFSPDQEKTLTGKVFSLQRGKGSINTHQKACELVDFFKNEQEMSSSVETEIISSIEEILNNILQHSRYKDFFLMGQVYPKSNRIRFVFYDNGMGIKNHMVRNDYDSMHGMFKKNVSEEKFEKIKTNPANLAIELAAKNYISATNYEENSGAGINFLIEELLPVSNGKMCILSEDGIIIWDGRDQTVTYNGAIGYGLLGTLVSLTLDCDPVTKIVSNE